MLIKSGYSKDKRQYNFTPYKLGDKIASHCKVIDIQGNLRDVKVTSVKTWKRSPNVEIHYKYGLYEYGFSLLTPNGFEQGPTLGSGELIEVKG